MSHRFTRREWALIAAAAPIPAQVTQKTPPQGAPAPAKPEATAEERLKKAYADVRDASNRLAQIELSTDIEPAFTFRAVV